MKPTKSKTRIASRSRGYNAAGKWNTESLTTPTPRHPTKSLPTDTQLMDILSSLWDSQGDGAKICGRFFPNPTGSFRAAVASFYENEIKKSKR